jgi:protein phosphatase
MMNQDFVYASEEPVGNLPNLFVVADGMGGHRAGDFASRYTVEIIQKSIRANRERNPIKIIRMAIETANMKVLEKANSDENLAGMGTTVVVATVVGNYIYVANVGDSRLYLIRDGIQQVTRDHSLVEEMVRMGEINREQARNHPDKNIITRAVGVRSRVSIDFFDMKLEKDDTVLMCSDGLSNMLEDEEIKEIIRTGSHDLPEIALQLIGRANQNGGRDNIAVVLIEPLACEVEGC